MKRIVKPVSFNPWLGLAVKGMWTMKPVHAIIAAAHRPDPDAVAPSESEGA